MECEVARRYLNTSPDLVATGIVSGPLDKLRYKMMLSGYSHKEREIIVKEGEARYFNIVRQVERGDRPLYRPSHWDREDRALKKKVKEKSWFGNKQSVIFVQSTPGEILRKKVEEIVDSAGFKVKVVEKGGRTVRSLLQKSDVSSSVTCSESGCPICSTTGKGGCQVEGVVYRVFCKICETQGIDSSMFGETGRTARIRCKEHFDALLNPSTSSNLREHQASKHPGMPFDFACEVVKKYPGDPLSRQLKEAVMIENHKGISMNDKQEWVRPASIRVRGERS